MDITVYWHIHVFVFKFFKNINPVFLSTLLRSTHAVKVTSYTK